MSERARNRLRQRWPSYTLSDGVPPDWASVRSLVHALRDSGAQVLYCNGIAAHACAARAPYPE